MAGQSATQKDISVSDEKPHRVEDLTAVWDEPERRAIDEHARCIKRWDRLNEAQRAMTTFHPWTMHLRDAVDRGRLDYLG